MIKQLNDSYIFVGLNPAAHDQAAQSIQPWGNFHSGDKKRSQDYKLRYALCGTEYWGAFITDVYPEIIDTDSNSTMKKVTLKGTEDSVKTILDIWQLLGERATIVAIGNKAYSVLRKWLPTDIVLKKIRHYSSRMNIDQYKETVLQQLR